MWKVYVTTREGTLVHELPSEDDAFDFVECISDSYEGCDFTTVVQKREMVVNFTKPA